MLIKVDATVKGPDAAVASGTPGLTSSAARDVVPSSPPSSSSVSSWQMALLAGVGGAGLAVIIAMIIIRQRNAKDDADSVLEDLDHPAYATTLDDNHLFLSHNTPMMVATDTLKPGDLISPLTEIGEDSTPFHTESDRCYRLLSPDELRLSRSGCPIPGGLSGSFDGERVLIRRLDHRDRPDVAKRFVQRVAALSLLKHEHVVELLGASKLSGISLCAVFEHMEHGTLSSFLHVERSPLTLHQAQRMCLEIADGVAYLQATGFVLGTAFDVFRTDRILVNDNLTCKLNIVTCLDDLDSTSVQLSFGTGRLAFLAPEVASHLLTTETRRDDMDDEAAAVYALGVILGEVLSRQRPYAPLLHAVGPVAADGYVYDMYMTRKTPRVPPHALGDEVPPAWTQVIAECLSYAPRDRPTAADVCRRLRSSCEGGVALH
ncbi:TKL protein kinase [Saprolegnia parasitica CBS 223.65]|uniref:TKL protein kinase n=1 Tax=Saprolegnia parasitica (strain CBS 223.65) TaxID=695850 RepID=A0A067BK11_SAPPC|nr:TKL protein kinase [Saprolegnia parasitica CBS 223.65]KDO18784.1 TKL protein kinase [Saprolegnia parasitica CBS 223.65]|eukprot:XP_012210506.1 TKL protein kinase [Saprolegnia parasitica CBS 223.65]